MKAALSSAAALRQSIESSLSARWHGALSPAQRIEPERVPCGVDVLDELLGGGLAAGSLTELVGPESSGRMTAGVSILACVTQAEQVCAWIDVTDSFDPESAAANGVDLNRLLWVRCGPRSKPAGAVTSGCLTSSPGTSGLSAAPSSRHTGGGSPHPRSENKDMPDAIQTLLEPRGELHDRKRKDKSIGTPGALNRPLTGHSQPREEQVNSDRLPPRRGENLALVPRRTEFQSQRTTTRPHCEDKAAKRSNTLLSGFKSAAAPWQALDQALRAADLLLHSGGFSVIVLDFGSVPPEFTWRVPLATWFRFRAACEKTRGSLLLISQHSCARSSAESVLHLQCGSMEVQGRMMTGLHFRAISERQRSYTSHTQVVPIRKPPQPEHPRQWRSEAAWACTK